MDTDTEIPDLIDTKEFEQAYGEALIDVLNIDTWSRQPSLAELVGRMTEEVEDANRREDERSKTIRAEIFPQMAHARGEGIPADIGVYRVSSDTINKVWRKALFNGGVDGCDATRKEFPTLPLTITQIGVCLTSYRGNQQTFEHRMFQRELREAGAGLDDVYRLLNLRAGESGYSNERSPSILMRRGIMTYAERIVLLTESSAPWRLGHGNPAPYELLTGSGSHDLLRAGLTAVRQLVTEHKRFVFIPSEIVDKRILTLGGALRAGEYAIVVNARQSMQKIVDGGKYNPQDRRFAEGFYNEVGPEIVIGVYRTSFETPPYVFYSHKDHCHEAALIAMADSLLQPHRGFPLLIDLADRICSLAFGNDIFDDAVKTAFTKAGAPFLYQGERLTRS